MDAGGDRRNGVQAHGPPRGPCLARVPLVPVRQGALTAEPLVGSPGRDLRCQCPRAHPFALSVDGAPKAAIRGERAADVVGGRTQDARVVRHARGAARRHHTGRLVQPAFFDSVFWLVRERRRRRGLPLPIADKVLSFRPGVTPEATHEDPLLVSDDSLSEVSDPLRFRMTLAEWRVAEAFAALQDAELRGASRRALDRLEAAYLAELATYESPSTSSTHTAHTATGKGRW